MAVIIFKPTEKCNSNCMYCDVVSKKRPITMSLEVLETVFMNINDYLLKNPNENKLTLIWHGGEPILLGLDFFKQALVFQEKHCQQTKHKIEHAIQSNLTLITQDFIDVFKQMGITQIGTSYEPIEGIRGAGNNQRNSQQYNRNFMRGATLLDKNNIGWGIIYVVNKRSLQRPLDIFYFLSNLKLRGGFMFNPVLVYGERNNEIDLAISPEQYAHFLGEIFKVWWPVRHRFPDVNPFNNFIRNIHEGAISLGCVDSGGCAFHHTYIGPDGETSQCGRSGDWNMISYGNIAKRSLHDIMNDEKRMQFLKRNEILRNGECKNCRFWVICHGGCPLDAYDEHNNFMKRTGWCKAKKIFLESYFEPITGFKAEFSLREKDDQKHIEDEIKRHQTIVIV